MAADEREKARAAFEALVARDTTVRGIVRSLVERAKLLDRYGGSDLARTWWLHAAVLDPAVEIPEGHRP